MKLLKRKKVKKTKFRIGNLVTFVTYNKNDGLKSGIIVNKHVMQWSLDENLTYYDILSDGIIINVHKILVKGKENAKEKENRN